MGNTLQKKNDINTPYVIYVFNILELDYTLSNETIYQVQHILIKYLHACKINQYYLKALVHLLN